MLKINVAHAQSSDIQVVVDYLETGIVPFAPYNEQWPARKSDPENNVAGKWQWFSELIPCYNPIEWYSAEWGHLERKKL